LLYQLYSFGYEKFPIIQSRTKHWGEQDYNNLFTESHPSFPRTQTTVPPPVPSIWPCLPMSGMTHLISSVYGQGHSTGDPTQTNVVGQRYWLQETKTS
jgi:hypothetical protein